MSDRILRALMHLFAIIAKIDDVEDEDSTKIESSKGKKIVEDFLKSELSSDYIEKYIQIFEEHLIALRGKKKKKNQNEKRTALHSVKILRICTQINTELAQRQKIIVLLRIIEFIYLDDEVTEREQKFVETVAETFHIKDNEFEQILFFVQYKNEALRDDKAFLYILNHEGSFENAKTTYHSHLDAPVILLYVESVRSIFFRYLGKDELYLNGQIVRRNKTHTLNIGSTFRTNKSQQFYYSNIFSQLTSTKKDINLTFEAKNIMHTFKNGKTALEKMSISGNSGNLIGLMGSSGSGKTTLLNVLNGKIKPKHGKISINGINLYENKDDLQGIIGNVSQDDLLIEELTVFQNLFFSAQLSMKGMGKMQLIRKVKSILQSIGLYEIRHLKVGSATKKVISGGQRKRLNIALELIREPSVLFVDEPTSGLSSKDSDNIMDLLKELSLKGKLIFVVIHQPSSNIFKLFDRLLILDVGGYLIFDGIPLNAIVHFKTHSFQGNAEERECTVCGNVNSEQIFNIIDSKIVDEYGTETGERKKTPLDWYKKYLKHHATHEVINNDGTKIQGNKIPSRVSQFKTYLTRDFLSKKSNKQYLIVNAVVSPFLAFTLSYFIKYFDWNNNGSFSYFKNENLPQYIFFAVIVAIFIGMIVSAEEIFKDKKNLIREEFIHLSRSSYLFSKIAILFIISATQALLFVLIGNSILEIKGMMFDYWIVLFTTACLSNVIGLNISSAFNSAKVIYIFVPLLIIPQLLFSGVIVKFDKLNPTLSKATHVPIVGNLMPSRWSYEAIAVQQSTQNKLEKYFIRLRIIKNQSEWKKDYWIPEIKHQLAILTDTKSEIKEKKLASRILVNEIKKEEDKWSNLTCSSCLTDLQKPNFQNRKNIDLFLQVIRNKYTLDINNTSESIQSLIQSIGFDKYKELKKNNVNEALQMVVTNRLEMNKIIILDDELHSNYKPIYTLPEKNSFFKSHFYSPYKYVFGKRIKTFHINIIILWGMTVFAYIFLYFDILKRIIRLTNTKVRSKLK